MKNNAHPNLVLKFKTLEIYSDFVQTIDLEFLFDTHTVKDLYLIYRPEDKTYFIRMYPEDNSLPVNELYIKEFLDKHKLFDLNFGAYIQSTLLNQILYESL